MYSLLGISLALALLLIVNVGVAIFANAAWNAVAGYMDRVSASLRGDVIFGLRILPAIAAVMIVAGFFIPSYVIYEPYATTEVVSVKLAALAIVAFVGVGFALFRVAQTLLATRKLLRKWLVSAERMSVDGIQIPIYRFEHPFPVVAVVGVIRPRIFVASQVIERLDHNELRSTLDHELGHLAAMDNLKRTLLRVCSDLLIVPFGWRLDDAWSDNTEAAADEFASLKCKDASLDLASALIKIAKMVPSGDHPALPVGAYLVQEQFADVSARVKRLVNMTYDPVENQRKNGVGSFTHSLTGFIAIAVVVAVPIASHMLIPDMHNAVEALVSFLQ